MTPLLIALSAFAAGLLGALTGLGGGIVLVPLLTVVFGVDISYAVGASLVAVIATSCASSASFVRKGFANIRIGILLEVATTTGALLGAFAAAYLAPRVIAFIFAIVLLLSAAQSLLTGDEHIVTTPDETARWLRLSGVFPSEHGLQPYSVRRVPVGMALMFIAGVVSAVLGIGSGVVKVVAMDRAMQMPFKVSTTTSSFMIGVTAAASAGVYLHRGYIDPMLALPVMLGVLAGASVGSPVLSGARTRSLRALFTTVMIVLAAQMLYRSLTGRI
ncbi:MAG TPA: sulfite exporter TauE/SafE family protein [Gemmatimonadaceae bacterium]|nr:sulfite exporter TauE/SafE family protein [Gemmatimonadaceae bacterium]